MNSSIFHWKRLKGPKVISSGSNGTNCRPGRRRVLLEDLIGLRVIADEGEDLGKVRSVFETGSNDVLVCGPEENEVLLPFIEDVVSEIDMNNGIIRIRLPEGLR